MKEGNNCGGVSGAFRLFLVSEVGVLALQRHCRASLLPAPFALGCVLRSAVSFAPSCFLVRKRESPWFCRGCFQQAICFHDSKALETSLIAARVSIVFFLAIFKTCFFRN